MGGGRKVEVIRSNGCSRLLTEVSGTTVPSFRGDVPHSYGLEDVSPGSSVSVVSESACENPSKGPFSSLVICVTGLSKEARKQVMEATERLGGEYSRHLHPQCTHLVVQSINGRKFEHALNHGSRNGLYIVTLGWFVDSVRRNVRMSESLYSVRTVGETGFALDDLKRLFQDAETVKSCLPRGPYEYNNKCEVVERQRLHAIERQSKRRNLSLPLSGFTFYIDPEVSAELKNKVVQAASTEGASLVDQWYVGCRATHVVCEGTSVTKYLGHSSNLITPLWFLKSASEKSLQRLVHISVDLARQIATTLDASNPVTHEKAVNATMNNDTRDSASRGSYEERQKIACLAKEGIRKRRDRRMQICQTVIRPITPSTLLDSLCWSISEPTFSASIYADASTIDESNEQNTTEFFDVKADVRESDASFVNLSRPLSESEKAALILKNHFLTILFPVDRFSEAGPFSRTFFSEKGFTCSQVLDFIYVFYQENMSEAEIQVAIHTDSRHADRLRSLYSSKDISEHGGLQFKRIDFMGSRKCFEMLKRVSGDNNSNVYELRLRA